MKILYLNPTAILGGAERSLLDIIYAVHKSSPETELYLLVTDDGSLAKASRKIGVTVHLLPLPLELATLGDSELSGKNSLFQIIPFLFRLIRAFVPLWKYLRHLKKTIELIQPDLIHSNGFKTHLLISFINLRIPTIWHIRDFVSFRSIVSHALQLLSPRCTMAIANSHAVGQDIKKIMPKLPTTVVYNAIDTEYFHPELRVHQLLDNLVNLPLPEPETLRIGLIATFATWKGQDIFLRAIAHILSQKTKYSLRFYIIGGAIYQTQGSQFSLAELQSLAKFLNISQVVGFSGFQENIANIYNALDIVIHASTKPEPFGRTIIEAMACGKPVIVAQAGGAAELFTPNYDAIGISPGDPTALAEAILDLVNNVEKRQMLSENARKTAIKNFSHQRLGKQLMEIYQTILTPNIQNQEDKF